MWRAFCLRYIGGSIGGGVLWAIRVLIRWYFFPLHYVCDTESSVQGKKNTQRNLIAGVFVVCCYSFHVTCVSVGHIRWDFVTEQLNIRVLKSLAICENHKLVLYGCCDSLIVGKWWVNLVGSLFFGNEIFIVFIWCNQLFIWCKQQCSTTRDRIDIRLV